MGRQAAGPMLSGFPAPSGATPAGDGPMMVIAFTFFIPACAIAPATKATRTVDALTTGP